MQSFESPVSAGIDDLVPPPSADEAADLSLTPDRMLREDEYA